MKDKAAEANSITDRFLASVPVDSGNQTTASEYLIPNLIWTYLLSLSF